MNGVFQFSQNGRQATVYLYGSITKYPYSQGDHSAATLVDTIKQLDADEIHLHIDSMGGSVAEGWAMYNALMQHNAKVITYADGFVASAALYPFLAGDERIANSVSAFYLHEAGTNASGYASDLRKAADEVDLLTDVGINAFVERTGQNKTTIAQLMKDETLMRAEQAVKLGIATKLQESLHSAGYTQDARFRILQLLTSPTQQSPDNKIKKFFA